MIQIFSELYNEIPGNDPRVADWPMMSSHLPTLAICLMYVYFSKVLGPKLMEHRQPFNLDKVLIYYNLFQVMFSIWLFYEALVCWLLHYNLRCQPVDYSNNPHALHVAKMCWWYYFSKLTELLDTVFFVLRKKNNQITTLHVIHHSCMPIWVWVGVKRAAGGHSTFFGLLNTFVHIFMYGYYLFAAMGPQYQKYLWWKEYLTRLQMVQFIVVFIHDIQVLFTDCDYPKIIIYLSAVHAIMFFCLFANFYKKSYIKQQKPKLANNFTASDENGAANIDNVKKEH